MSDSDRTETKRDRVRRLLITPLLEYGMRRPSWLQPKRNADGEVEKTLEDVYRDYLNRLADNLGYMTDDGLDRLRQSLVFNGEPPPPSTRRNPGRRYRDEFPSFVAVFDLANAFEECPLHQWPGLRSWFGSVAGPKALQLDTAVETYDFILALKRPPFRESDRRAISEDAARRRAFLAGLEKGFVTPADENRRTRYVHRLAKVKALIQEFQGQDDAGEFHHREPGAAA
ncbi:MAG: hypothetical protein QNJ44_22710 [Rhodobacter sp.]|nr:hypothetical protein [Rhodobacter sp.]